MSALLHNSRKGTSMISDQLRNDIWQELLDSDRFVRYYEALANHDRRKHLMTLLFLAAGAASSVAAVFELVPEHDVVRIVANAVVGVMALWVFFADYAKKAEVANSISTRFSRLDIEWRSLWTAVEEEIEKAEAHSRYLALAKERLDATQRSGDAGIVDSRRLNEKSEVAAFKTVSERYA